MVITDFIESGSHHQAFNQVYRYFDQAALLFPPCISTLYSGSAKSRYTNDMNNTPVAITGNFLSFQEDPATTTDSYTYVADGMLVIEDGHISGLGPAAKLQTTLHPETLILDHSDSLIIPGFVDTHVHYPQCEIIASYGKQLIEWLSTYTFPAEAKFNDASYAEETANFFLDQLISNGTTTALVFGTVHPQSVDAFFAATHKRNMRMICGKVMMDRNAPDTICDTPESAYTDSRALIEQWHDRDRLGYAITPRFAPTSSNAQLEYAGMLKSEFPDVHVHTHLSENQQECEWVQSLFPERKNYVDVYDHYGLTGSRSVFAHSIHLSQEEWETLATTNSSLAHCPTSNLFIGSGLFNLTAPDKYQVPVGIGTDIGGGDSFSILRSLNEAYKIQQLQGHSLSPFRSLYLATLGGARALDLDSYIGNFDVGKEADLAVLNPEATPLMAMRNKHCHDLESLLFMLLMLGDDRAVSHTYILGVERKQGLIVNP